MALQPLITEDDLVERMGLGEVTRYAQKASDPNKAKAEAIAIACDRFRSAASRVYTIESIDALTPETITPEPKHHILSDACDVLSAGNEKPEFVATNAAEAAQWRKYLAGGAVPIDGLIRIGSSSGGSAGFGARSEPRVFGRRGSTSDDLSEFDLHDPRLP